MKIILGCGSRKGRMAAPAWQLYTGSTFGLALAWARSIVALRQIYILSAKYGLIRSMDVIVPYNAQMGTTSQVITIPEVTRQAVELGLDQERPLLVNAGKPYRAVLQEALPQSVALADHWNLPRDWIGFQRSWFKHNHRKLPASLHDLYL